MRALAPYLEAACVAGPAPAETVSETVFQNGNFRVDVNIDDDGDLFCDIASFDGRSGSYLAISSYAQGYYYVNIFMDGEYRFAEIDLVVGIDRNTWTLNDMEVDQYDRDTLQMTTLMDEYDSGRFLEDLARGNTFYINYNDGSRAATWSLVGSRNAINAFRECLRLVRNG